MACQIFVLRANEWTMMDRVCGSYTCKGRGGHRFCPHFDGMNKTPGDGKAPMSPSQDAPASPMGEGSSGGAGPAGAETPHLGEFESFLNTASDNGATEAMFEQHVGQIAQQTQEGRRDDDSLGQLDPALSK
jgi:hypothetical protein